MHAFDQNTDHVTFSHHVCAVVLPTRLTFVSLLLAVGLVLVSEQPVLGRERLGAVGTLEELAQPVLLSLVVLQTLLVASTVAATGHVAGHKVDRKCLDALRVGVGEAEVVGELARESLLAAERTEFGSARLWAVFSELIGRGSRLTMLILYLRAFVL